MEEVKKITPGTVTRTICLALALVNTVLNMAGIKTIEIGNETIETFMNSAFIIATAVWSWWKNNDITRKARTK